MKKDELTLIIDKLDTIYEKKPEPKRVDAYNFALGNQSRFRVIQACMIHFSNSDNRKWYPKPGEISGIINDQRQLEMARKGIEILPSQFDEACYWIMFSRGITDPGELTEKEINQINERFGLVDNFELTKRLGA